MTDKYRELAFTPAVRKAQEAHGSARAYARDMQGSPASDHLGELETDFIQSRDSFYMASVAASGWPYVQHRGGPIGFLKVVDPTTLVMADYRGNRQYISLGNFADNDRVSLFLMDYPRKGRLKIYARVEAIDLAEDAALVELLNNDNYKAKTERALKFSIEAFDWNCPQHITPRYTETDIKAVTQKLTNRITELEKEVADLR